MPKHSPMDALHEHLDRAAQHGPRVHRDATDRAAEHFAQPLPDTQPTVSETLTVKGV